VLLVEGVVFAIDFKVGSEHFDGGAIEQSGTTPSRHLISANSDDRRGGR
jgi:hypothetical protein